MMDDLALTGTALMLASLITFTITSLVDNVGEVEEARHSELLLVRMVVTRRVCTITFPMCLGNRDCFVVCIFLLLLSRLIAAWRVDQLLVRTRHDLLLM